jgi:hypothetical protein
MKYASLKDKCTNANLCIYALENKMPRLTKEDAEMLSWSVGFYRMRVLVGDETYSLTKVIASDELESFWCPSRFRKPLES